MHRARSWLVVVVVLCGAGALRAEEPGAGPSPKRLSPAETVDAVLQAVRSGDADALRALARRDRLDPWRVADDLCARGAFDAAEAFARAVPRKDVERLPAYVEGRRVAEPDLTDRQTAERAFTLMNAGEHATALDIMAPLPTTSESVLTARIEVNRGTCHYHLGRYEEAISAYRPCVQTCRGLGWYTLAIRTLRSAVGCAERLGDYELALELSLERLDVEQDRGDPAAVARTHGYVAHWYGMTGDRDRQLDHVERGIAFAESVDDLPGVAQLSLDRGAALCSIGRFQDARRAFSRCLRIRERIEDDLGVANALRNIAISHRGLGEFRASLPYSERAAEMYLALGEQAAAAAALSLLGGSMSLIGDLAEGFALLERALRLAEVAGDSVILAECYQSLALAHGRCGQTARADEFWRAAFEILRQRGSKSAVSSALALRSLHEWEEGRRAEAQAFVKEAIGLAEEAGNKGVLARCLRSAAVLAIYGGAFDAASSSLDRALALSGELGDSEDQATAMRIRGLLQLEQRDFDGAIESLEASRRVLVEAGLREAPLSVGAYLSVCYLEQQRWAEAIREARDGVRQVLRWTSGLAELERGGAKDVWRQLFQVGTSAAFRADDAEAALFFLDTDRATGLRETLNLRRTVGDVWVAEDVRSDLVRLSTEEAALLARYRRARARGRLDDLRQLREGLERTRTEYQEVIDRLQRRKDRGLDLLYPQAASLKTIQGALGPSEALVVYGSGMNELVAAVIRRETVRLVPLASPGSEEPAPFWRDVEGDDSEPFAEIDQLRKRLVSPLALEPEVERVLISPVGELAYLPFRLLVGDRDVCLVPSATSLTELAQDGDLRGSDVLALGDPDYGIPFRPKVLATLRSGRRLTPLPHTRAEVESVGDRVLLGAHANETNLADALTKKLRWRAVHFACHGLLDAKRPMFSSLALSPDDASDGLLTVHEVLRMRVPTDLVVLSACETGRGKSYATEGVVGLMRAFMCAGAPRVLVSLWDVDDRATQALMVEFYELWNPDEGEGLGAAAALRKAQDHVRSHEEWEHPRYWAAWVLWGLPE